MMKSHHRIADLFSLFILLILLCLFLLLSPLGLKAVSTVVNAAGIGLEIHGVKGTLLQGVTIETLSWTKKEIGIELKNIKLKLHATTYSNDVFNINSLTASALNIYIPLKTSLNRNKPHIVIPDIPIPLNLVADHVQLDTLRIIRDRKELLFKIDNMQVSHVSIIDNQLHAKNAVATPIIWDSPLTASVDDVSLDFNKPHRMSGVGTFKYSQFLLGDFSGEAVIGGTLTHYSVNSKVVWDEHFIGQSNITLQGNGNYKDATISSALLEHAEGRLQGSGEISWIDFFSWQGKAKGYDIHTRKYSPQWPAVVDLVFNSKGEYAYNHKKWLIDFDLESLKGEVSGFPIEAKGLITLKDSILRAEKFAVKTDKNKIFFGGKITEPFKLEWDIDAKKVGQLLPGYSGSVIGKGIVQGTTFDPTGSGQLTIKNVKGEGVSIEYADIDVKAGAHDNLFSGKGKGTIRNFLFQDYKVGLAEFEFDGIEKTSLLEGKGSLHIQDVISKDMTLSSAQFDFNGTDQFLKVNARLKRLNMLGQTIDTAQLDTKGSIEKHNIKLIGKSKKGDVVITAKGGWFDEKWTGKVNKIALTHTEIGDWLLKKPVKIAVSSNEFSGSEICISNPKRGQLCTHTRWNQNNGLVSKGEMKHVPLSQFKPWLPESMELLGVISGTFDIKQVGKGLDKGLTGVADFILPDSAILLQHDAGGKEKFAYRDGKIKLKFKGKKIETSAYLKIDRRGEFSSKSIVTLRSGFDTHRIKGEAKFVVADLSWAQEFLPDITNIKGNISSKVSFSGLLAQPQYSGEIELKKGRFSIPDTGTHLSNVVLLIKTTQPNQATIKGFLSTGNSKLLVDGGIKINKLNDWLADLTIKGNNLPFMNTHEVQAFASPDLHLKITPQLVKIMGSFTIPKAKITLSELPETAIYESDDVVFVKDKKSRTNTKEKEKPLRIQPNVTITLGDDISFNGFGLKAKLAGEFHVRQNNNTIVSRGSIQIKDGQYTAYGQRLKIEHGVLVFNGPVNNPGLDIRATRSIDGDDIKVGINLAGTLQKPKSSIFSDPPLSESDAVSYLITGQSLSETSGDQTQLLVQAVRTLGINSGSTILNRIGGSVGLDDLNIITYADYKKNKLQLGKKLGPNLYIRYITGLFDTFHQIAVDYKLSSKWSLQAESGEAQGVDFIYNIDTN